MEVDSSGSSKCISYSLAHNEVHMNLASCGTLGENKQWPQLAKRNLQGWIYVVIGENLI